MLFIFLTFNVFAKNITIIELDLSAILSTDEIELTVDNREAKFTAVKQDDILYIDSNFFSTFFPQYDELIKNSISYEGVIKFTSGEEVTCLPILSVLNTLGMRYTYSTIYGKELVRIRTDNDFSVNPNYTYKPPEPATTIEGNPDKAGSTIYTGTGQYWWGIPGHGYYYPPGYEPGFYFGDYGFIPQGPVKPVQPGPVHPVNF